MGITRKSLFGFPPAPRQGSQYTQREVPLSQGVQLDQAWPSLAPGSTISMSNFLPLDGVLVPRSKLSSLNTIRTISTVLGMSPLYLGSGIGVMTLSGTTVHGFLSSNGSISRASFVSSFGLGVTGIADAARWQYTQVFSSNLNDNMLVVAGTSSNTIMCVYLSSGGVPQYSYLTSAPQASAVGSFDNYILAWNTREAGQIFGNRIRWNVRGLPSNWTGEGSGFEDLLAMKGTGTAVVGTADNRMILFTNLEIWYGVNATYPAQFLFAPLDPNVGCSMPSTIRDTDAGLMFLGSDAALRVIPRGGGVSQVVSMTLAKILRDLNPSPAGVSWAVYNPATKIYHLFLQVEGAAQSALRGLAYNVATGAWGFMDYISPTPISGAPLQNSLHVGVERVFYGNSTGTVYSANSTLISENGAVSPSGWRSAPIAADLPGNYKQLTQIDIDYRATSRATLLIQVSQDGGNTYDNTINTVSLPVSVAGRATAQVYVGGALPTINVASSSTGYELHRIDVTMALGGRRSG